jgi:hypothetical protein
MYLVPYKSVPIRCLPGHFCWYFFPPKYAYASIFCARERCCFIDRGRTRQKRIRRVLEISLQCKSLVPKLGSAPPPLKEGRLHIAREAQAVIAKHDFR